MSRKEQSEIFLIAGGIWKHSLCVNYVQIAFVIPNLNKGTNKSNNLSELAKVIVNN